MVRHPFTHTRYHIFKHQRPSTQQSPIVSTTFTVKGIPFFRHSNVEFWMFRLHCADLPKARKHMTHSDVHVKRINGCITTLDELSSPIFGEIKTLVTPILISQNALGHNTLDSYSINNQNATVEIRTTLTQSIRYTHNNTSFNINLRPCIWGPNHYQS